MSDPLSPGQKVIREAAEEARRETAAAVTEIRLELRGTGRETRIALQDAMAEVREAMHGALAWDGAKQSNDPVGTRLGRSRTPD